MPMTDEKLLEILRIEEKKLLFEKRLGSGVITGEMIALGGMREIERRNVKLETTLRRLLKDGDQDAVDAAHAVLAEVS